MLPRISDQANADRLETAIRKMRRENFIYELFFRLPLYMDKQPLHSRPFPSALSGAGRPPSSFFSHS